MFKELRDAGVEISNTDKLNIKRMFKQVPKLKEVIDIAESTNDTHLMVLAIKKGSEFVRNEGKGCGLSKRADVSITDYELNTLLNTLSNDNKSSVSPVAIDFMEMSKSPLFSTVECFKQTILTHDLLTAKTVTTIE